MTNLFDTDSLHALAKFFNNHHDKLVITASKSGEPNISLMGTPRLQSNGIVKFEISDRASTTLRNIKENSHILFLAYVPGRRARDYFGARIYAQVTEITTDGRKMQAIREAIRAKHGDEKADELQVTVACSIMKVRPIVDKGQKWNREPFDDLGTQ